MLDQIAFGALVSHGLEGLTATSLPFLVVREPLRLIGHVARANAQWRAGPGEALMILQGPSAYISPSLYPSKAEHGRVVPTWNYEAAHVHGQLSWFDEPDRLLEVVEALTDRFERDRIQPWAVADAPGGYVQGMLGAIVGFEFTVTRIEAARKHSQNRSDADQAGVIAGLSASPSPSDQAVAQAMRRGATRR
jgi:transcriptional regulator